MRYAGSLLLAFWRTIARVTPIALLIAFAALLFQAVAADLQAMSTSWQLLTEETKGSAGKAWALNYLNLHNVTIRVPVIKDQGVEWRDTGINQPFAAPPFIKERANLDGIDLSAGVVFGECPVDPNKRVVLTDLVLGSAKMDGANMQCVNFGGPYSRDALIVTEVERNEHIRADFSRAHLVAADFSGSILDFAGFKGALLKSAKFNGALIRAEVIAPGCERETGQRIRDEILTEECDEATGQDPSPVKSWPSGVDFSGAAGDYAQFNDVDFGRAVNFRDATLRHAEFVIQSQSGLRVKMNFKGADLRGAKIRGYEIEADFTDADLRNADLSYVVWDGSKFDGAKLVGAKLVGADISGATGIDVSKLDPSQLDSFTLLPSDAEDPRRRPTQNLPLEGPANFANNRARSLQKGGLKDVPPSFTGVIVEVPGPFTIRIDRGAGSQEPRKIPVWDIKLERVRARFDDLLRTRCDRATASRNCEARGQMRANEIVEEYLMKESVNCVVPPDMIENRELTGGAGRGAAPDTSDARVTSTKQKAEEAPPQRQTPSIAQGWCDSTERKSFWVELKTKLEEALPQQDPRSTGKSLD